MGKYRPEIDPEFKSLIPPLLKEELDQLEKNVIKDGCLESLKTWNGTLIDGHNRLAICERNNISYSTMEIRGIDSREDAIIWIIQNQVGKRNLQNYQKAELAIRMKAAVQEKAKKKQESGINQYSSLLPELAKAAPIHTYEELGKMVGLGKETVRKYDVVLTEGSDEVKEKVKTGEMSINKGYAETRPKPEPKPEPPKEDDRQSIEAIKAFAAELKKPLPSTGSGNKIHNVAPIITDLTDKLKSFVNEVAEYQYISNKVSPELRTLIDQTIARLNNIKSKIKEK